MNYSKSLPYMGSNYCCFQFKLPEEFESQTENGPLFIGQILNTTILGGDDFITFYEGDSFNTIVSSVLSLFNR